MKDKNPLCILVIEDNPGDRLIIEEILNESILQPTIDQASNFKTAQTLLTVNQPGYDVILLDLTLPDKVGEELIKEIISLSNAPIVVLTGNSDLDFSIRSISQGISDYLLKDHLSAPILYKSIIYAIERKKAIHNLKESEKRYSNLFFLSPQPMWVFDPETLRFLQVNTAAINHYGYTEEEFLNMTILEIRPKEEIDRTIEDIKRSLDQQENRRGTYRHRKKSGEIIEVEIYSTAIRIEDKNYRSVIAIDITEKVLMENKITKAIIKTQEDERYEIGSELHDNICQILAVSQMSLGMLKNSVSPEKFEWFERCKDNISLAIDEIRRLSHRLAPAFLDDSSLYDAFKRLINSFTLEKKYAVNISFDDQIRTHRMNPELQLNLYRILQEQLKNIIHYSNATAISIEILLDQHRFRMITKDNGIGFDPEFATEGIGIANMKRRAALFSGTCVIEASPGKGCQITVDIPLA